MKFKSLYLPGRACLILLVMLSSTSISKAELLIYQFQPPAGISTAVGQIPEVAATFQDVGPGKVALVVNVADSGAAFLRDLYLNFDPVDNLNRLHFQPVYGNGLGNSGVSVGKNSFSLSGYGAYDIHLSFGRPDIKNLASGCSIYEISEPGLNASDFAFMAFGGTAPCFAVARIQGVGGNCSGLVCSSVQLQPVPEPGFAGFIVLAAGAGCLRVRRRFKKPLRLNG